MKTSARFLQTCIWLIALVLFFWTLRQLPTTSIMSWISSLGLSQWLIWGLMNTVIILIYVYRWYVINQGLDLDISFPELLVIRQAGQSVSYITPGPQFGGEPFQVYWIWKQHPRALHSAFLSVALDRFFELWINFSILLVGLIVLILFSDNNMTNWYYPAFIILVLISVLLLTGVLLAMRDNIIIKWIKRAVSRWQSNPRLKGLETHMDNVSSDINRFIKAPRHALYKATGFSILGWAGMLVEVGLILSFLEIEMNLVDFIFLVVAMRLALLLPVPGGVGTTEAAVFWVLLSLGINNV